MPIVSNQIRRLDANKNLLYTLLKSPAKRLCFGQNIDIFLRGLFLHPIDGVQAVFVLLADLVNLLYFVAVVAAVVVLVLLVVRIVLADRCLLGTDCEVVNMFNLCYINIFLVVFVVVSVTCDVRMTRVNFVKCTQRRSGGADDGSRKA